MNPRATRGVGEKGRKEGKLTGERQIEARQRYNGLCPVSQQLAGKCFSNSVARPDRDRKGGARCLEEDHPVRHAPPKYNDLPLTGRDRHLSLGRGCQVDAKFLHRSSPNSSFFFFFFLLSNPIFSSLRILEFNFCSFVQEISLYWINLILVILIFVHLEWELID